MAAAEVFPVERRDGLSGFRVVDHFDEAKAARFARLAIGSDVNARELSEGFEQCAQIRCSRLKAHVANKQVLHTFSPEALRSTAAKIWVTRPDGRFTRVWKRRRSQTITNQVRQGKPRP